MEGSERIGRVGIAPRASREASASRWNLPETGATFTHMSSIKRRAGFTRLSPQHQVTIPAEIVAAGEIQVGTEFKVSREPDGRIVLHPAEDLAAIRRRAIDETSGSMPGIWKPGDLERLRDEWR